MLSTLSAEIASWDVAVRGLWQALLYELGFSDSGVHARLLIASLDGICQHFAMDPENYPLEAVGERLILLLADPALPGCKK